jgi:heme-degrading monooxygenase HmoA
MIRQAVLCSHAFSQYCNGEHTPAGSGADAPRPARRCGPRTRDGSTHETGDQDVYRHEPFPRKKGSEEAFEKVWLNRDSYLAKVPGFVEFRLLKGPEHADFTLYASTRSGRAGRRLKPGRDQPNSAPPTGMRAIDHPQFEGFEVRQTVRRGAAAVA